MRLLYGGSAKAGADYAVLAETVTIPVGSATTVLTVAPVNDTLGEGAETVQATLDSRVHYLVGAGANATLTIADNDASAPGTLQFSPTACTAGESDGVVTFTVTRAGGTSGAVGVSYTATGGSAQAGADYTAASGTLSWPAGDDSAKSFDVPLVNDTLAEGAETLVLTLTAPTGSATLGAAASATATILDHPIDNWRFTKFGANANDPAIAGALVDVEGDGIVNLIEYGLDLNPLAPSPGGMPVAARTGGQLTLAFTRNPAATDIVFTVQVSGDLATWLDGSTYSALGDTPNTAATSDITPNGSPAGYTVVRDNAPANAGQRFIRLRIMRP